MIIAMQHGRDENPKEEKEKYSFIATRKQHQPNSGQKKTQDREIGRQKKQTRRGDNPL